MDADFKEKRRARISSNREKRWSMNSQRLEEIVAELMRPIGDLRHSFDTDLSALLEEYLTEAGLHALQAEEEGADSPRSPHGPPPNFAELALLLQQSASIYGRKVDFLYQHVLSVSDSLHNSTIEMTNTSIEEEPPTPGGSRRKRRASVPLAGDFSPIELVAYAGATREAHAARPPPTLPRMYIELEPRAPADGDETLRDYAGEPIGVLADFHVSWRLQNGLLVEELDGWEGRQSLRPIPLMELQAAIEANAPPSPPPLPPPPRDDTPPPPPHCSTPLPAHTHTVDPVDQAGPMPPPPPPKKERKRKSNENLNGRSFKLHISAELRRVLSSSTEFEGAAQWVARVVAERMRTLLAVRRALAVAARSDHCTHCDRLVDGAPSDHCTHCSGFRGFEYDKLDISGFVGWSAAEAEAACGAARAAARLSTRRGDDSDDDGFFELSSLGSLGSQGDSDASRVDDSPLNTLTATATAQAEKSETEAAEAAEWAAWRARVAAKAAAGEARAPLDVRLLAASVLALVPPDDARAPGGGAKPFADLLAQAAHEETDVSRLFLATLFLANAGNVEIVQGPPLTLNSFSLKLLSTDARLYSAAAAADPISAPVPLTVGAGPAETPGPAPDPGPAEIPGRASRPAPERTKQK